MNLVDLLCDTKKQELLYYDLIAHQISIINKNIINQRSVEYIAKKNNNKDTSNPFKLERRF